MTEREIVTVRPSIHRESDRVNARRVVFRYRSFTPIPFLIVMVVFAEPTLWSIVLGLVILLLGESVRFWGVSIAGSETRTTGAVGGTFLITNGPFAYCRNPLYVGNMVVYLGVGVMSMALFPWLQIVALLWFYFQYSLIVAEEEEYLGERFGSDFTEYMKNVPRFIPRLVKYVSSTPPPKQARFKEGLSSERRTLQAIGLVTAIIVVIFMIRQQG